MYSEGNTYRPIDKWTIFVRDSNNEPWRVLEVTTDRDRMEHFVSILNDRYDYQRYAQSRHTV